MFLYLKIYIARKNLK